MRKILNVRGTQSEVSSLEVNIDTVYIRENITQVNDEDFTGWQYDETQYAKDEYLEFLVNKEEVEKINNQVESLEVNSEIVLSGVAESYQKQILDNILREDEGTISMTALAEAYELIITLSGRIQELEAQVQGGN